MTDTVKPRRLLLSDRVARNICGKWSVAPRGVGMQFIRAHAEHGESVLEFSTERRHRRALVYTHSYAVAV